TNVPGFLHSTGLEAECPGVGSIKVDVAYGGNFYAIVEPQTGYRDMADFTAGQLIQMSPVLRRNLNAKYTFQHPENPTIKGLSHILWTGAPKAPGADARNAVFYGDKALDRSPCGTGTSARMAQLAANGKLKVGDSFVHESIIGSLFKGRVEEAAKVGNYEAIVPSVEGWARITGYNTIFIDDRDPYKHGFQVI
ncbi:MAG TPA: proline racemase family protein, partial [Dongiaceae bacterium]